MASPKTLIDPAKPSPAVLDEIIVFSMSSEFAAIRILLPVPVPKVSMETKLSRRFRFNASIFIRPASPAPKLSELRLDKSLMVTVSPLRLIPPASPSPKVSEDRLLSVMSSPPSAAIWTKPPSPPNVLAEILEERTDTSFPDSVIAPANPPSLDSSSVANAPELRLLSVSPRLPDAMKPMAPALPLPNTSLRKLLLKIVISLPLTPIDPALPLGQMSKHCASAAEDRFTVSSDTEPVAAMSIEPASPGGPSSEKLVVLAVMSTLVSEIVPPAMLTSPALPAPKVSVVMVPEVIERSPSATMRMSPTPPRTLPTPPIVLGCAPTNSRVSDTVPP